MITALDFGSTCIRSVFRNPERHDRLMMYSERSEYVLIRNTIPHRETLESRRIPFAECEDSLAVVGNAAADAQWLSHLPPAGLFVEGQVPDDDPPARQMLNLLVASMLPRPTDTRNICVLTVPGAREENVRAARNEQFLCRLVSMQGYEPFVVTPAEAAMLSTCGDAAFTGLCIVLGAETSDLCIARHGVPLATASLPIGATWIDLELARQFRMVAYDPAGECYLDTSAVRAWKHSPDVHLRDSIGERERALSRLYSVVLDRVTRAIVHLLESAAVRSQLNRQRIPVVMCGGASMIGGCAGMMTERLIANNIADRVLSVRCADDAETATVRGALICAELEARLNADSLAAA